jgi:hypothetical protein
LFPTPINGIKQTDLKALPVTVDVTGYEFPLAEVNPTVAASRKLPPSPFSPSVIGVTTYDLQSNASVCNRVANSGGHISATWTRSVSGDLSSPDRGTGYNHKMPGGSWGPFPASRIEPVRTGWPNIVRTANGTEHVVAHRLNLTLYHSSSPMGGSSWTFDSLPSIGPPELLWARMAVSGNTLHVLSITLPIANGGAIYNGLNGCPIYQRSDDDGATWSVTNYVLPGVNTSNYAGWSADAYAIDARGNVVAITHGQLTEDWAMWKSTDNGNTWTRTVIMDFPFVNYQANGNTTDLNGDGVGDTILTVDHNVAVLIDNNNMVHCWAGAMICWDATPNDSLYLSLGVNAMWYWNESMGSSGPVIIASTPDVDGDGQLALAPDFMPRYGNGNMCTRPHAAIHPNGTIILSFTAPLEYSSTGTPGADFTFRSTWMIGSTDNGNTWSDPVHVAGTVFDEAVFGTVGRNINSTCVDLLYQMDGLPGTAVQPPNQNQGLHPFGNNDIIYDCIPVTSIVGIKDNVSLDNKVVVYPNPVTHVLHVSVNASGAKTVNIQISDVTGKILYSDAMNTGGTGKLNFSHSVKGYASGLYLLHINADGAVNTSRFVVQ